METILRDCREQRGWFGDGGPAHSGQRFFNKRFGVWIWDFPIGFADYAARGRWVERKSPKDLADRLHDRCFPSSQWKKGGRPSEWDCFLLRTSQAVLAVGRKSYRIVVDGRKEDLFRIFYKSRLSKEAFECKLSILGAVVDVVWAGSVENAERHTVDFLLGDAK